MYSKKYLPVIILVLTVFSFLSLNSSATASVKVNNGIAITGPDEEFKPVWKNYLKALEAARDALYTDDFSTAKDQVDKLKEASEKVQKSDIPPSVRKGVKKALKYTKKLIKAYNRRDREGVKVNLNHIKDSIAEINEARGRDRGE